MIFFWSYLTSRISLQKVRRTSFLLRKREPSPSFCFYLLLVLNLIGKRAKVEVHTGAKRSYGIKKKRGEWEEEEENKFLRWPYVMMTFTVFRFSEGEVYYLPFICRLPPTTYNNVIQVEDKRSENKFIPSIPDYSY